MFGYSASEAIGQSIRMLFPAEHADEERKIMDQILRGERVEHADTIRVRKDGRRIDVSATISPIRDAGGRIVGASKIARDITSRKRIEAELRRMHEQWNHFLAHSPAVIYTLEIDGERIVPKIISANIERFVGYTVEECSSFEWWASHLHPQDRERVLPSAGRTRDRRDYKLEYRIRQKNGRYRWIEDINRVVDGGRAAVGVWTDVTKRRKAEEALRRSERELQLLVEQAPVSIAMLDRELNYIITSRRWLLEFGGGRTTLAGGHHYESNPDIPDRWKEVHRRALAGEFLSREEDLWIRADGSECWLRWTVQPWRGVTGEISGIIIATENITERKRAEAVSLETQTRFRQLAENVNEVFWMVDPAAGAMLYVSPAYERIWGRSCDSLYQNPRSWVESIHPEDRERVVNVAASTLVSGEYDEEYRIVRSDGGVRWIHDRGFPIRDSHGKVYRVVGTAEDITRRKKLEEQFRQSQKMESIGLLAGGVAHDFNNILAVIQMQIEMLTDLPGTSAEHMEAAAEIRMAVERAAGLTRQLLLFSRREVFQPREIDMSEAVIRTAQMLRRVLGESIKVNLRVAPQPMMVRADPGMIDQVLLNLCVNARDAMPEGGELTLETCHVEFDEFAAAAAGKARPGGFVQLSVSDNGCGMPQEILAKIFEPFFTTKGVGKGTGLGLATVFGIVEQHDGWINVYSEVGLGTVFRMYIPRIGSCSAAEAPAAAAAIVPGGIETILMVEDDPALRVSVRKTLTKLGYRVLEAPTGLRAMDVWNEKGDEISLLLTDLVLPDGMTGRNLVERLRQERPDLKIVYMSGYSSDVVGKEFFLKDADNFLTKPFTVMKIAETIRRVLNGNP